MNDQTNTRRAVIVTALGLEYNAIRSYLTNLTESTHHGTIYETGTFTTSTNTWHVTILETGMGNANAAVETERAISQHHPDIILFVGIAGGLKDARIARPDVGTSNYDLVQRAKAEARKHTWHTLITSPSTDLPRVLIGPIAAGEKVLTSRTAPLRKFLNEHYNDALAIEMDGRGFLAATYANTHTKSIVIRGISDFLDNKSASDAAGNQALAAPHASAFAFHLLATLHPAPQRADQELLSLGHHAHTNHGGGQIVDGADTTVTFTLTNQTAHELTEFEIRVQVPLAYRSHADQRYPTRTTSITQEFIAREAHTTDRLIPKRDVDVITITFHVTADQCQTSDGEPLTVHIASGTYERTDAISKVEDAVERLIQTSLEVYGIQHTLPRDQARDAAARLIVFITRRLTHATAADDAPKTLVFLSRGGTCRDPMAKAILDQLLDTMTPRPEVTVLAAGIGPIRDTHASFAARHAIKTLYGADLLKDHVPTLLTRELTEQADIILAMDRTLLGRTLPKEKTYLLTEFLGAQGDIADPYPDGKTLRRLPGTTPAPSSCTFCSFRIWIASSTRSASSFTSRASPSRWRRGCSGGRAGRSLPRSRTARSRRRLAAAGR